MTAHIDDLLVEALISAPGCPETIVERMLRVSTTDFYRGTNAWRYVTDITPAIKGQREAELDIPADTMIGKFYWVKLDGKVLDAISRRNLCGTTGTPRGCSTDGSKASILFDVIPQESYLRNGVEASLALIPASTLNELPDELFASHRDGILYGAVARLLAMANVSWGDLNKAQVYASLAMDVKASARTEAESRQAPIVRVVRYGGI